MSEGAQQRCNLKGEGGGVEKRVEGGGGRHRKRVWARLFNTDAAVPLRIKHAEAKLQACWQTQRDMQRKDIGGPNLQLVGRFCGCVEHVERREELHKVDLVVLAAAVSTIQSAKAMLV